MKPSKPLIDRRRAAVAGVLIALCGIAAAVSLIPETAINVPNIFSPNESKFQNQTHFLVGTGSDTAGENATTATAYYDAIDPTSGKRTFAQWLVKTGFISDVSQWNPTGPQQFACDLPGCDYPRGTYGQGIINADAHAIVLNASDLGFVRNQFIRCDPSCSDPNPKIYTYLENYPVNPFANSVNGGSGFPVKTGYPTQAEAAAAINSALSRPLGQLQGCSSADTPLGCSIQRIADVAFEWAPQPTSLTSSFRYAQLYAFVFSADAQGNTNETIVAGGAGGVTPNVALGILQPFTPANPFPPNLDFLGNKQVPGNCLICHGGSPKNLTSTGQYPRQGVIDGFRLLPLDIRNLLFTSNTGTEAAPASLFGTSRLSQEPHIKLYNQAVLKTIPSIVQTDEEGTSRVAHAREVIVGWYEGSPGDQTMSGSVQKDYIPLGWRGSDPIKQLYTTVIGPSCRTCHFNRELSLDFGTVLNFDSYRTDVLELTLLPFCRASNPQRGMRPMPLAHLTYQRFWEANPVSQVLPAGDGSPLILQHTADQIAQHFGYASTAAYCATVR